MEHPGPSEKGASPAGAEATTKPAPASPHPPRTRRCLVTVGATASFRPLLEAALAAPFLDLLAALGFGELVVQTGVADEAWAVDRCRALAAAAPTAPTAPTAPAWPAIQTLSYTTDLAALMLPCRGSSGSGSKTKPGRPPGVVVAHAGAGTILDAARLDVPLVVVSNPALLHDHQAELAEAVAAAGWAVRGVLDTRGGGTDDGQWLADAVRQAVARADADAAARQARQQQQKKKRKPSADEDDDDGDAYHEPPFPTAEAERCGLFDWTAVYAGAGRDADDQALLRME